jgi:asparagine synthase (glutamine-hydrolysing)
VRGALTSLAGHGAAAAPARWADRIGRWSKRAADSLLPPALAYQSKMSVLDWETLSPVLSGDLRCALAGLDPYAAVHECLGRLPPHPGRHPLAPFVYAGLKVSLPGDMLVKVDRMSMANSLEVRVPLLDHLLVEFVARIPIEQRFPRFRLKGLFKDTLADALPPEVLSHGKHGFTVPLARWLRGDLPGFARDILLGAEARQRGLLDPAALERLLDGHQRVPNIGGVILCLLMLELWCRQARP